MECCWCSNATQNHTLLRKCDVTQGNDDWTASAGTDAVNSEWIVMPIDDWTDLGVFTTLVHQLTMGVQTLLRIIMMLQLL